MQVNQPQGGAEKANTPTADLRLVSVEQLQKIHRDLDACQKVIWLAGCRPRVPNGFDPSYVTDAQERLQEIAALLVEQPQAFAEPKPCDACLDGMVMIDPYDGGTFITCKKCNGFGVVDVCPTCRGDVPAVRQGLLAGFVQPAEQATTPAPQWTHDKPTQPGAYWIRGNLLQDDALVQVKLLDGVLFCNLHQVNSDPGIEFGFTIAKLSPDFEWLGPLAPMGGR